MTYYNHQQLYLHWLWIDMCFLAYAILCVFLYVLVDTLFKQCKDQLIIIITVQHHYLKHQSTSN